MTDEMNPYADSSDAAAQPAGETPGPDKRRRLGRLPKAALTGGIVAGLALGGTGVGFAFASTGSSGPAASDTASNSSTTTTVPGTHGKNPAGGPRRGPGPAFFGRGGGGGAGGGRAFGPGGGIGMFGGIAGGGLVHGQFTIKSGSGYKTEDIQSGQVTKVSSTSITVSSPDGFSQTYAVITNTTVNAKSGGISSVADKDQVEVVATEVSKSLTATSIVDMTALKNSRTSFGFGPPTSPNPPTSNTKSASSSAA